MQTQADFGFTPTASIRAQYSVHTSAVQPLYRAKRKAADWRRQLARAYEYVLGKSPELAEELIAEYEAREREGPEFARQRPDSIVTEAPLNVLNRDARRRLYRIFHHISRGSWRARGKGKHRGALTRCAEAVFEALMYLAGKHGRVFPSLEGLAYLAKCARRSVVDALDRLVELGFVTRVRRLREVDTPLGFKTVQDTNAYVLHEPTKGLGLLAKCMFSAECKYCPPSEAFTSNLSNAARFDDWLDPDSPLGKALTRLGGLVLRENRAG